KIAAGDDCGMNFSWEACRHALSMCKHLATRVSNAAFPSRRFDWSEMGSLVCSRQIYPGDPVSSFAMCWKVARNGNDFGRCRTMRRTEATTSAPIFKKRSRSVDTCARAQLVVAADKRNSCINT